MGKASLGPDFSRYDSKTLVEDRRNDEVEKIETEIHIGSGSRPAMFHLGALRGLESDESDFPTSRKKFEYLVSNIEGRYSSRKSVEGMLPSRGRLMDSRDSTRR